MKLKYYLNNTEISSKEYVERVIDDAKYYSESKTTALRIVRENRQEARSEKENVWRLQNGDALIIRNE